MRRGLRVGMFRRGFGFRFRFRFRWWRLMMNDGWLMRIGNRELRR